MIWKNKHVFITGCSGVIGRQLTKSLLDQGALVRGIDLVPMPVEMKYSSQHFTLLQKDILQLNPVEVLGFQPEVIFHLAAAFERSEETTEFWENNYLNNLLVEHKIADVLRYTQSVTKVINATSYLVYDPALYIHPQPQAQAYRLAETSPKNPRNLTGAAKYYGEKEFEFWQTHLTRKLQVVNARIYRVYGKGSKDIISRWVQAGIEGQSVEVYGEYNSFDYIHADDVAKGLIKLAESDFSGAVNLATGSSIPITQVLKELTRLFPKFKIKKGLVELECEQSAADISLLTKLTGWQPELSIQAGIQDIVAYEKTRTDKL